MLKKLAFAACGLMFSSALLAAPVAKPHVVLTTSLGEIEVELEAERAPASTRNFLGYVQEGFYKGTQFHRVIPGFMVQGGGFTADLEEKETAKPIRNESDNGLHNVRGTIAMARTSQPDSATSQFYINLADNPNLDGGSRGAGYAVFGTVVRGLDVIDKIARVQTGNRGMYQNVPLQPILILDAKKL